jgi:hypothetical protein
MKLVKPLDMNIESSAAQLTHRAIQLVVARNRRQIVEPQVGMPDRRQNASEQDLRVTPSGGAARNRNQLRKLTFHFAQAVTRQRARRQVGFEVEFAYFRRQPMIVSVFQNFHRHRRRPHRAVE